MRFKLDNLGLQGTGKTTVARLIAGILKDSGVRPKGTFIESSAQKLKDLGPGKAGSHCPLANDQLVVLSCG